MTDRFVDVYMDREVPGYPCMSTPRWSTGIVAVDSGVEQVNQRWEHPLHRFTLPDAIREHSTYELLHDHWMVMRGPAYTWPFRDPLDFASVGLEIANTVPQTSMLDQVCGTGDGATMIFQLQKTYTRGSQTYTRIINHPVVDTVQVSVAGVHPSTLSPPMTYSVSRTTGEIVFSYAPSPGQIIRAGYLFDVEVRFESDDTFDGIVKTFSVTGFADITLLEIRPC